MKNNRPKHGLNIKKNCKKGVERGGWQREDFYLLFFCTDNVTISGNQIIGIYKVMQKMG